MKILALPLKILIGLVILGALVFIILVIWLSLNEYKPSAVEEINLRGSAPAIVPAGKALEIYTWNIGYAALDDHQDFFMDGGKGVRPVSQAVVEENVWAIQSFLASSAADFVFLQEVDENSHRSYGVDQVDYFSGAWKGSAAFAVNYRCKFVPSPFPRFMGRVESGIVTLSNFAVSGPAERRALPGAFSWPVRLAQLKRCLLVERLPVQNSEKELVLVNLHLEAYDSGAGKEAQTAAMVEFLKSEYEKGNYCVAGGDFNQNFPGAEERFPLRDTAAFLPGRIDPAMLEGWTFAADTVTPSARLLDKPYDGTNQHYVIDGFAVSPNITVNAVQTIDLAFRNSDHNPVKLSFTLNP